MEIRTFLPCACFALIAAMNSASDSTFGHSATGQRLNRMSPDVTDVGSPNDRLMMSHAAGTSAIRTYPEPLAKLACRYPMSACFGSPVTGGWLVLGLGLVLGLRLGLALGLALADRLGDGDAVVGEAVGCPPGPSREMSSALYAPVPYHPWMNTW